MNKIKSVFKFINKKMIDVLDFFDPRVSKPVKDKNIKYSTILHQYALDGKTVELQSSLIHCRDLNVFDQKDRTPLHVAAKYGNYDSARILIDEGATTWLKDKYGNTPLHLAAKYGHNDIAELLLVRGAFTDMKNQRKKTPLHYIVQRGELALARKFINLGARVNELDDKHRTPLHWALIKGYPEFALEMVYHGARIDFIDDQGNTPLDLTKDKTLRKKMRRAAKHYQPNYAQGTTWKLGGKHMVNGYDQYIPTQSQEPSLPKTDEKPKRHKHHFGMIPILTICEHLHH